MANIKIKTKGMHCKSCEMLIKDSLEENEGIKKVEISNKNGITVIDYDEKKIDEEKIKQIIRKEGYGVE